MSAWFSPVGDRVARLDQLLFALTFVAAIGSGLIGGVFYAFSTFVMKALGRLPAREGIAAMQSINVAVINPLFLGVFIGTAAACAAAMVAAFLRWEKPGAAYLLVGGALYLFGTFGVTMVFNVPLNNSLAAVTPGDPDAARHWARYMSRWTAWNHVRTATAIAAMGSLMMAMRRG
jgi:uncharacterized membrane protein